MNIENLRREGCLIHNEDDDSFKSALLRRFKRQEDQQWRTQVESRIAELERMVHLLMEQRTQNT